MIPIRKSRLLFAVPVLFGAMLSIEVVARFLAKDATQVKLIGDTIFALLFAVSPFFMPFLLRFVAARRIPLTDLVGAVRAYEVTALMDQIVTLKGKHPELLVLDSDKCEAVCIGTGASATIFVTKGLINTLSPNALLATIAHEMGHLHGKHLILQGLMFASFFFIARTITIIPPYAAPLFLGLYFLTAWRFEYAADRFSALHVSPRAMEDCCVELAAVRGQSINPEQKLKLKDYISTHPNFAARIQRLRQMKGAT